MKSRLVPFAALMCGVALPSAVVGHHSIDALYDRSRTVEFAGVLLGYDFANPHVWFRFAELAPGGSLKQWSIEAGSPTQVRAAMEAQQLPAPDFPLGQRYTVRIAPPRADAPNGFLKSLVLPDGRTFAFPGPGLDEDAPGRAS
jgi:hypothetical protein